MDATQMIDDSIYESEEEDNEEDKEEKREPLAKLRILKNNHVPETEMPLYLGENVLGRDPSICTLPLPAGSVSKQHTTICISVIRAHGHRDEAAMEALVWDMGSMNGTRKGYFKLSPHVRYALSEGDRLVVADIPCQYVTCAVDKMSKQEDVRSPANKHSEKHVSRDFKTPAMPSSHNREETKKTAEVKGLSFERTPTQPQGTLVPESDSDSEEEEVRRRDRRLKAVVSESHASSPTCSSFLSPGNKTIPESEDETLITPSSSYAKYRSKKCVGSSLEEEDVDVERHQLRKERAQVIVDDSAEEEEAEREEEETTPGEKSRQDVPLKQANAVRLPEDDGAPVSTPALNLDGIPAFHMDSDTDVEGEGEETAMSAGPVTLKESQTVGHSKTPPRLHMDSDRDGDGDADALNDITKSVPASNDCAKHTNSLPAVQSTGINLESDTDDDDDDDDDGAAAVSSTAARATATSLKNASTADTAPHTLSKDFHADSDTDVDEKDDHPGAKSTEHSTIVVETPQRTDPGGVEPAPASHNLQVDSDTEDEGITARNRGKPPAADTGAHLEIRSDSDTDLEEEAPQPPPVTAMATKHGPLLPEALSVTSIAAPIKTSAAALRDSDVDTAVKESGLTPPTRASADLVNFELDSDTDVDEEASQEAEVSDGVVEEMETGASLTPSPEPSRAPLASTMRPVASSLCSESTNHDDVVVAETQSFILESRDHQGSLSKNATQPLDLEPLSEDEGERQAASGGLSDSSHLQLQAQALAMEDTQAFVLIDGDVNPRSVQEYGTTCPVDRNPAEDPDMEATQAYEENRESASKSDGCGDQRQVDFALEATQLYPLEPREEEESINEVATAETQQFFFPPAITLAMAETQPMSACREEEEEEEEEAEGIVGIRSSSTACRESRKQSGGEEREEADGTAHAGEVLASSDLSTAETQPLGLHDSEESDSDCSIPAPIKRKAKPLRPLEDEESQPVAGSGPSEADTQPMLTHDSEEEAEEQRIKPLPTKREGRSQSERPEVPTGTPTSAAETKPEADEEEEEANVNQQRANRRSQRGRGGRESEAGTSTSSQGGRRERGGGLGKEEGQSKSSELPKKQTTGKGKASVSTRGRIGETRPEEEEVEDGRDEKVQQAKRGRGRTFLKRRGNEQEERERIEGEEGVEMERQERARQDRLLKEQERSERALREQEERERLEEERKAIEDRERIEQEERETLEKMKQQEQERLDREKAEKEEKEREERERERREQENMERERKEREETERLERERKELEKRERMEREMKKHEEQRRLEREMEEQEQQARQEREKNEKEQRERLEGEREQLDREVTKRGLKEEKAKDEEHEPEVSTRVSRAAKRRTTAAAKTEPEPGLNVSNSDDVPARRTGSRSNSSNSVSSERSASSVTALQSQSRGRGRGAKTASQPVPEITTRHSNRRRIVAGDPSTERGTTEQKTDDIPPRGVLSRPDSPVSRSRGKGGRGRKRASEPEEDFIPPVNSQINHSPAPRATARGRKSRKVDGTSSVCPQVHPEEQACFQQPGATRGRKRAGANDSEPAAAVTDEESQRCLKLERVTEDSFLPQSSVQSKDLDQNDVKCETVVIPVTAVVTDEHDARENGRRKGRKRELEEVVGDMEGESGGSKISKGKPNVRGSRTEVTEEEEEEKGKSEVQEVKPAPVPASRGRRASTAQGGRNGKEPFAGERVKKQSQKMEVETVDRSGGRQSVTHQKNANREEGGATCALVSTDRDAGSELPEVPQTLRGRASNKRAAPAGSSPATKTPRTPSASPRAVSHIRASKSSHKILFTGVTDEAGEKVVGRLGGSLATGVVDVTHLVTDKVRRTVKFLCALARGVPIVTTDWLVKCGKAGSFLCPDAFLVNDKEQEKKFNFCLEESLRMASSKPLLQGYSIHVTKSVKPEPMHMKDIICCSGATYLPKMPSSHKAQTVVISCEEDWSLCGPALSASLPVVNAEFILTGILQQMIDFETHALPAPTVNLQSARGRGRGRKKS